ncbi:Pr6Pr family membrane protein [uncultured Flavobacterium sp.]|uniref:Pr6Pr family membrane protein n=1 Tax=uncultured Flavobacterium sp. TaxID=165435 RepID=UPI00292E6CB4|nr:Pr6Pr family membrane protein [uncultured Flavobacterium sp.]
MNSIENKGKSKMLFASITAFFAWFAILFQLYLTEGTVTNFFSYFTILSNLLVALCVTFSVFFPQTKTGIFFSGISVQTAIALYIFIVALVYNIILRGLWVVKGWQLIVDNLLHVLNPILYILYWFIFASKERLTWRNGIYWIFFPFAYLVYSLIRGSIVNWYPYPFLNVTNIGYQKVFINTGLMIILFFAIGLGLIAVNNKLIKR